MLPGQADAGRNVVVAKTGMVARGVQGRVRVGGRECCCRGVDGAEYENGPTGLVTAERPPAGARCMRPTGPATCICDTSQRAHSKVNSCTVLQQETQGSCNKRSQ